MQRCCVDGMHGACSKIHELPQWGELAGVAAGRHQRRRHMSLAPAQGPHTWWPTSQAAAGAGAPRLQHLVSAQPADLVQAHPPVDQVAHTELLLGSEDQIAAHSNGSGLRTNSRVNPTQGRGARQLHAQQSGRWLSQPSRASGHKQHQHQQGKQQQQGQQGGQRQDTRVVGRNPQQGQLPPPTAATANNVSARQDQPVVSSLDASQAGQLVQQQQQQQQQPPANGQGPVGKAGKDRWTAYLERLHAGPPSLEQVLSLAEATWPAATAAPASNPRAQQPPQQHQGTPLPQQVAKGKQRQEQAPAGKQSGEVNVQVQDQQVVDTAGSEQAAAGSSRMSKEVRGEVAALVDTLEALGHLVTGSAHSRGSSPGGSDSGEEEAEDVQEASSSAGVDGTAGGREEGRPRDRQKQRWMQQVSKPQLTSELVARTQAVTQLLLVACQPHLEQQHVLPKQLAQVARAINTLASASAPTNTRQVQGRAGAPTSTATDPTRKPGRTTSQAVAQAAPASIPDAVLPSLPPAWSESYAQAVVAALPAASPRAFCYLLRALSLDRVKRLLRAQKRLARPLMDHLANPSITANTAAQQPSSIDSPLSRQKTKAGATTSSTPDSVAHKDQGGALSRSGTRQASKFAEGHNAAAGNQPAADAATTPTTVTPGTSGTPAPSQPAAAPTTQQLLLPGQLAQVLSAEQATLVLSCGAQLVWPPDHPWLQAVLSRLEATAASHPHALLTPSQAAYTAVSLAKLGAHLPAPLPLRPQTSRLLLASLAQGFVDPKDAATRAAAAVAAASSDSATTSATASATAGAKPAGGAAAAAGAAPRAAGPGSRPAGVQSGSRDGPSKRDPARQALGTGTPYPPLTPLQLSSSMWALAKLQVRPPAYWLDGFMATSYVCMKDFEPGHLTDLIWALAKLRWAPSQLWLDSLFASLTASLPAFSAPEVAIIAWALSRLREKAPAPFLHALSDRAAELAPQLEARAISMLFVAWGRLQTFNPRGQAANALCIRVLQLLESAYGPTDRDAIVDPQSASPQGPTQDSNGGARNGSSSSTASAGLGQGPAGQVQGGVKLGGRGAGNGQQKQGHQPTNVTGTAGKQAAEGAKAGGSTRPSPAPRHPQADPTLTTQTLANLAWASSQRGLYHVNRWLYTDLLHASLAVGLDKFSPEELGMLGEALGNMAKGREELPCAAWTDAYLRTTAAMLQGTIEARRQQRRERKAAAAARSGSGASSAPDSTAPVIQAASSSKGETLGSTPSVGQKGNKGRAAAASVGSGGTSPVARIAPPHAAASMLLGAARVLGGRAPPEEWLNIFCQATEPQVLIAFGHNELEVLCEGLTAIRDLPPLPLPWVQAFCDRKDLLFQNYRSGRHLRKQVVFCIDKMKQAWRAKAMEAEAGRAGVSPPQAEQQMKEEQEIERVRRKSQDQSDVAGAGTSTAAGVAVKHKPGGIKQARFRISSRKMKMRAGSGDQQE